MFSDSFNGTTIHSLKSMVQRASGSWRTERCRRSKATCMRDSSLQGACSSSSLAWCTTSTWTGAWSSPIFLSSDTSALSLGKTPSNSLDAHMTLRTLFTLRMSSTTSMELQNGICLSATRRDSLTMWSTLQLKECLLDSNIIRLQRSLHKRKDWLDTAQSPSSMRWELSKVIRCLLFYTKMRSSALSQSTSFRSLCALLQDTTRLSCQWRCHQLMILWISSLFATARTRQLSSSKLLVQSLPEAWEKFLKTDLSILTSALRRQCLSFSLYSWRLRTQLTQSTWQTSTDSEWSNS